MEELFEKLINDKLTPQELQTLRQKVNAMSDEELLKMLPEPGTPGVEAEDVPQSILDNCRSMIEYRLDSDRKSVRRRWLARVARVAAVVIPLVVVACVGIYMFTRPETPAQMCTVSTAKNETSSLSLPDGSKVEINGRSILTFPSSFGKKQRMVSLEGEAYFDVAKNPKAPFIICTPAMEVTVTGTSFNLLARKGSTYSELALDEGNVSLKLAKHDSPLNLKAGQKIILDNETGEFTIKRISTANTTSSWTTKEMVFENASPEYVISRLRQNYDTIISADITRNINENFTGTLPADDLDAALKILRRLYKQ